MNGALRWVELLARLGYASKGVVHVLVGLLAAGVAFGIGGKITDSEGALEILVDRPLGSAALVLLAVGLLGYALWRYACALLDSDRRGKDPKGIALRVGFFVRATLYTMFAVEALRIVLGRDSEGGDADAKHWAARLLAQPFGAALVFATALVIGGYGLYHLYAGFKGKLGSRLRVDAVRDTRRWIVRISRFGLTARGIVFLIVAGFFLRAAAQRDAGEAAGVAGALRTILRQSPGGLLLGLVAAGLVAYGLFQFVKARYREVDAT